MNEAALECMHAQSADLKKLNNEADTRAVKSYCTERMPMPVEIAVTNEATPFLFKGVESYLDESPLTGSKVLKYGSRPNEFNILLYEKAEVVKSVAVPLAYCIPGQFLSIAERLQVHGIEIAALNEEQRGTAGRYRFSSPRFAERPYEGRQRVECTTTLFEEEVVLSPGTFFIPTAQRTVRVIVNLLEPASPDSFLQWGYFNAFFERKEYAEPYIMEPIAREMIQRDKALREEFYRKLDEDETFRDDPLARLEFFYERSPFFDKSERVYPIMRIDDPAFFTRLNLASS
jgi:hypothetical protein